MKSGQTSDNAVNHVGAYVGARIAGANKQESALQAGYSETTARKPSLIENTKAYAVVITETLNENATALREVLAVVRGEMQKDVKNPQALYLWTQIAKNLTAVHTALTPRVTIKETTDKDGNKTRSIWGTGDAPSNV